MPGKFLFALLCLLALVRQAHAQEVIIAREASAHFPRAEAVHNSEAKTEMHIEKAIAMQPTKPQAPANSVLPATRAAGQVGRGQPVTSQPSKAEASGGQTIKTSTASTSSAKPTVAIAKPVSTTNKEPATPSQPFKAEVHSNQPVRTSSAPLPAQKQEAN